GPAADVGAASTGRARPAASPVTSGRPDADADAVCPGPAADVGAASTGRARPAAAPGDVPTPPARPAADSGDAPMRPTGDPGRGATRPAGPTAAAGAPVEPTAGPPYAAGVCGAASLYPAGDLGGGPSTSPAGDLGGGPSSPAGDPGGGPPVRPAGDLGGASLYSAGDLGGASLYPAGDPGGAPPHPTHPAPPPGTPPEPTPASPRTPRSMASPHRDGDLRRTFPAFPPRPSGGEEAFAGTWWGAAWIAALERGALDVRRLARGRGYAQQGHVDAITVTPGLVLAYVRGSRPRPYRVQVRLRTLDDTDWERFLDAAADRPGHIAALLDKEMPPSLADGDVPLLPGPGDLAPRCSCPDRGHPCKHAAALCYQTARLLDADPFVLLLLRGRGERELLDALSRRSATRAARAAQEREPAPLPGVRATDALARGPLPPLPPPSPVPPHPGHPPVYPAAPGGPDPFALDQLATDAAARAHALLGTGRDPVAELSLWQDAVRLAAARPGSGLTAGSRALYSSLASAAGRTPAELARAVAAWRQGGPDGLAVLEEPWDPPAGRFDRARPLLLAADLPAFRPWRNRLTHPQGHVQLRLGRDALWYAYESEPGQDDWWPRGTPDPDPVGALTGLGAADEP
ncbi:SWIM zinc finger family protein, partial [Streptomyces cinereospinus]